ncbi:hypothetical protein FKN01_01465 [Streptomyces sp. 130]|uniref:hypothetical protein n=1 Tax=Streptomyces sp. 130 TaxID=2591006 RepID=UPI001180B6B6|nr:hypothetical protein [Streptomyces sp. 130]TRV81986.1 hypothetical protein FKN01_01465 [Streptomyces sp. 130]
MQNGQGDYEKLPTSHPFRKHSQNLTALTSGLRQAERMHKQMIRQGNEPAVSFSARMHSLMIGMIAEARLKKIIYDPQGFNERERKLIGRERSQIGQWVLAVDCAFRRQYEVAMHLEIADLADTIAVSRYAEIIQMLKGDLAPIIEGRNKVAHGEWVWEERSKEGTFRQARRPLNYLEIKRRGQLIDSLAEMIHILIVSEPTFQRDFDDLYKRIDAIRPNIDGTDYTNFAIGLRASVRKRPGPQKMGN